jgi:hypothetical protein
MGGNTTGVPELGTVVVGVTGAAATPCEVPQGAPRYDGADRKVEPLGWTEASRSAGGLARSAARLSGWLWVKIPVTQG